MKIVVNFDDVDVFEWGYFNSLYIFVGTGVF